MQFLQCFNTIETIDILILSLFQKNPLYLLIWLRGLVVKQVSQFEDLGGGLGKQPRSDLPSPSVTNSPQNLTTIQ